MVLVLSAQRNTMGCLRYLLCDGFILVLLVWCTGIGHSRGSGLRIISSSRLQLLLLLLVVVDLLLFLLLTAPRVLLLISPLLINTRTNTNRGWYHSGPLGQQRPQQGEARRRADEHVRPRLLRATATCAHAAERTATAAATPTLTTTALRPSNTHAPYIARPPTACRPAGRTTAPNEWCCH